MSHYSADGDAISCDAPYIAIGFRGKPSLACLWIAVGHFSTERSGGVAAIVCDTTGNTVRQRYCYTCLAGGGGAIFRSGHQAQTVLVVIRALNLQTWVSMSLLFPGRAVFPQGKWAFKFQKWAFKP